MRPNPGLLTQGTGRERSISLAGRRLEYPLSRAIKVVPLGIKNCFHISTKSVPYDVRKIGAPDDDRVVSERLLAASPSNESSTETVSMTRETAGSGGNGTA